jgi:hypothetical protein
LGRFGRPATRWDDVLPRGSLRKTLARRFLLAEGADTHFRKGWIVGQNLQTPDVIEASELIINDVPYAATLAVQRTWFAYNDTRFRGVGWLVGVVGPLALGEETQKGFHDLIGASEPKGWSNQLRTEPLVNVYWLQKRKVFRSQWVDIATSAGIQVGNLITGADVTVEARFGMALPPGYVYVPDPVGLSLSYDTQFDSSEQPRSTLYGSMAARAAFIGHALLFDGNTLGSSHSVPHEPLVESLIVGLHYQRERWGIHLNLWFTTDTVDGRLVTGQPDTRADFGTLMLEFRR